MARDAIRRQLDNDNIVLLSNLGFTAAGEVLNCNTYDVGLHAAMELGADKLICLHLDDVKGDNDRVFLVGWLGMIRVCAACVLCCVRVRLVVVMRLRRHDSRNRLCQ